MNENMQSLDFGSRRNDETENSTSSRLQQHFSASSSGNDRAAPKDTRANDIWHWQTVLRTANAEKIFRKFNRGSGRPVSRGIAEIPGADFGFSKGFLARDPDGHGLQIVEK